MKKGYVKRLIASLLSAVMITQIPLYAAAQNVSSNPPNEVKPPSTVTDVENVEETEPYILEEVEEKRTENEKYFRLSDGSYMVAQYDYPVHYQDENETWKDYDNTLTLADSSVPEEEQEYHNQQSDQEFRLAKKVKKDKTITIKTEDHEISWGYLDAQKSSLAFEQTSSPKEGNDRFLKLDKVSQTGWYRELYEYVDLQVICSSAGVKENLVLHTKDAKNEFQISYKFKHLTAEQKDPQTIVLKDQAGQPVYTISAPVMYDSALSYSDDITLEIVSQKTNALTIKLCADEEWLQDPEREYPVTLDPYIQSKQETDLIHETYTDNAAPNDVRPYTDHLLVGMNGMGTCRSYVKFVLPDIEAGAVITNATLNLYQIQSDIYTNNPTTYINVYDVAPNSFDAYTLKWNNQSSVIDWANSPILDYQEMRYIDMNDPDENPWISFTVTSAVKEWYQKDRTIEDTGFMLKSSDESVGNRVAFLSSDNNPGGDPGYPVLVISYLHNAGLESYWSYHDIDLGRGGTASVNDFTGNLVVSTPITETTGSRMPLSVSLVYNGYSHQKFNDGGSSTVLRCGQGFQLNCMKRLEKVTDAALKSNFPYRLLDEDGTYHYFKKKGTNEWEDEEGKEWKLKKENGVFNLYYKDGSWEQYANADAGLGVIYYSYDIYGNYLQYRYDEDKLIFIVDGAGRRTNFTSNGRMLTSITTPDGKTTSFSYVGNLLTDIDFYDGTSVHYAYEQQGRIERVDDTDDSRVSFYYRNSIYKAEENRVATITRQTAAENGTRQKGTSLHFFYDTANRTTILYDRNANGKEDSEDFTETCSFSNAGQLLSTETPFGSTSMKYKSSTLNEDKNKVESTTTVSPRADNKASNTSAENEGYWGTYDSGSSNYSLTYDSSTAYIGNRSLKVTQNADTPKRVAHKQFVSVGPLAADTQYTFSAYVKTQDVTGAEGKGALIFAECYGPNGEYLGTFDGEPITGTNDWERVKITFTAPKETTRVVIHGGLYNANGTMWMDAVQMEPGDMMNKYNMVENCMFYKTGSDWVGINLASGDGKQSNNTYRITGRPNARAYGRQLIPINKANVCFSFSGKAMADSVAMTSDDRRFAITVGIFYADGSETTWQDAHFSPDTNDWQYVNAQIVPKYKDKVISHIGIYLCYYDNCNKAYFDDISMNIDETGTSYSYDDNGNIISSADNAKRNQTYSFSDANELTHATDTDNNTYDYVYDPSNEHKLKVAKMSKKPYGSGSLGYYYTYDSAGNPIKTQLGEIGSDNNFVASSKYMESSVTMSENKAYPVTETDVRGKTATYDYGPNSGLLYSITNPRGVKTEYLYRDNQWLDQVRVQKDGTWISNYYGYRADGSLSSIYHNGFNYRFTYDGFGNQKTVRIQDNTPLITNSYSSNGELLTGSTYGNGDTVEYIYDKYDRLTSRKANGQTTYQYAYDVEGRVGRISEPVNNIDHEYYYDIEGKLIKRADSNGNVIKYQYDNVGRVAKQIFSFDGITKTTTHDYGIYNRDETCVMPNGAYVTRNHDSFNRPDIIDINPRQDQEPKLRIDMGYLDVGVDKTTTFIETYTNSKRQSGVSTPIKEYEYTYDDNGNILTIQGTDGEYHRYEYDVLDQLTVAVDGTIGSDGQTVTGKKYVYTYDNGGNRLSEQVYTCTEQVGGSNQTVGELIEEKTYSYADTNWKDLLTSFNGNSITYDASGNPTTYYDGRSFTWQGRQLRSATNAETDSPVSFQYDSYGNMIGKKIGENSTEMLRDESGTLLAEKTLDGKIIYYLYDNDGSIMGFVYDGEEYYYVKNAQGDITGILDSEMDLVVSYTYDSYGNLMSMVDGNGNDVSNDSNHIGNINPYRYRGYYYEAETGFYYLTARFYDPELGRFINADGILNTDQGLLGHNMFAYCGNNPIMNVDPSGLDWRQIGNTVYLDAWTYDMYYSNTNNWQGGKTYIRDPGFYLYNAALPPDYYTTPEASPKLEKEYREKTQADREEAARLYNNSTNHSGLFSLSGSSMSLIKDIATETCLTLSGIGTIVSLGFQIRGRVIDPDLSISQKVGSIIFDVGLAVGNYALSAGTSGVWSAIWGIVGFEVSSFVSTYLTDLAHEGFYYDRMYLY